MRNWWRRRYAWWFEWGEVIVIWSAVVMFLAITITVFWLAR